MEAKTVKLKRLGKVVCEIPVEMFPLEVELEAVRMNGAPYPRTFVMSVNYWKEPTTYAKIPEKPKGLQLS